MSDLLLEFFSEEIPARMQARAESDLARLMKEHLDAAGLSFEAIDAVSGPRRLGLHVTGLPEKTKDVREERKGPRVGAPEKAVEGFLRGAGLESLDQCETRADKKGEFYVALIEKPGRAAADVISEAIPAIAKGFPWPKSMKFGEGETAQRWVRPLQRVLCLLGGQVVPLTVFGIEAGDVTEGHRIHGSGPFAVTSYADYEAKLAENGVILQRAARQAAVLDGARSVCAEAGLELVEDMELLKEVTGLVEHPVAVLGDMDPGFLDLPPEVITLTMKVHQRYFAVRDPKTGDLAPKFVMLANQTAPDGGKAIAAGAARVLSARLSDARHFWDADRKRGLDAMASELSKVTFHEKLGTVADKTERVAALARELAPAVGADLDLAELAAKLAKADLVSQMVYEFPELQGVMGRYYALQPAPSVPDEVRDTSPAGGGGQGDGTMSPPASGGSGPKDRGGLLAGLTEDQRRQVADAVRDHYKPQGPSDEVPTAPVSAAVALADKLDTLVGFWAIDEKPTGSKDPYALRRAALGVIRVLLELGVEAPIKLLSNAAYFLLVFSGFGGDRASWFVRGPFSGERVEMVDTLHDRSQLSDMSLGMRDLPVVLTKTSNPYARRGTSAPRDQWSDVFLARFSALADVEASILAFFADRLKVHLKDEGVRHDVIDAVFALGDDDLVRVTKKARALQGFIDTEDGAALLSGYRRAANILRAEEKKGFDLAAARAEVLGAAPSVGYADTSPASGGGQEPHPEFPADPGVDPGESRDLDRDEAPDSRRGPGSASPSGSSAAAAALTDDQAAALMIAIGKTAREDEERHLIAAIEGAVEVAATAARDEDFEGVMRALAGLRAPVDAFFEAVTVNADDQMLRRNRLLLLSRIRDAVRTVADFDRLEG